jgi:hypothetical protein
MGIYLVNITFTFLLPVLLIGPLFCQLTYLSATAYSPSFARNEVKDPIGDGWSHTDQEFTDYYRFVDMKAISFFSNGEFLNATFFLNSPFIERPSNDYIAYGMLVDADSNYDTGWQGFDYSARISWNNKTNDWQYLLEEWSSVSAGRLIDKRNNISGFFGSEGPSNYVHFSLDLDKMASPNPYRVVFYTDYDYREDGQLYEISDFSNIVHIPPPDFIISTSPDSVNLRPGEDKSIEVLVNSSVPVFRPSVKLYTNQLDDLETRFTPAERDIPPIGIATTYLNIKAPGDALPGPHTLDLFGNISFPAQYYGGESQIKLVGENITEYSNLPVTILGPLPFSEIFKDFWGTYGGLITLIGGGFGAGFAAVVFEKFRKKKKSE